MLSSRGRWTCGFPDQGPGSPRDGSVANLAPRRPNRARRGTWTLRRPMRVRDQLADKTARRSQRKRETCRWARSLLVWRWRRPGQVDFLTRPGVEAGNSCPPNVGAKRYIEHTPDPNLHPGDSGERGARIARVRAPLMTRVQVTGTWNRPADFRFPVPGFRKIAARGWSRPSQPRHGVVPCQDGTCARSRGPADR
jgi:hypothetical protein